LRLFYTGARLDSSYCRALTQTYPDLGISENRVLKKSFEPKGQKVTGGWRKLHGEQLQNFLHSRNIMVQIK